MDLELGLKITKTRDDIASISEYRLAKAGPIFQSRETNTAFILTAHLKGYKRNNINIKISEDGSKMSISGEKPVQNILMMGWLMHRKEVDVAGFNKVFKIPDGVKLDGIKAKFDEEEWIMNIIMPKLVKGICGAKIEEVKEEESDRRRSRSEQEKSEGDYILSGVGETSQKGAKESEVQEMEDSESFREKEEVSNKMLDDSNRKIIKDTVHKEVEKSKVGNEGYEAMKTSELERDVGVGISQKIGEASQKEIEESTLKNEDGRAKVTREDVGKAAYEAVKTLEKGENVGEGMQQNIRDTRKDKEFEVQEMEDNGGFLEKEEKGVRENVLDDGSGNLIGEVIKKDQEEPKSGIKDRDGESVKEKNGRAGYEGMKTSEIEQNVDAHVTQNIGDTLEGVSKESDIMGEDKSIPREMLVEANVPTEGETLGESNVKQFGEPKSETEDRLKESVKESRMELMERMKASKLDQNVDDQIPSNIGGISQEEFKESGIQRKEKTESIKVNMDVQACKDGKKHILGKSIQENMKRPKVETGDGDQEYDGVKAGKEEFDSMVTIREEFPQQLSKGTIEEGKGLSISKMQETEDVKEAKSKSKLKENEYFVDKGEGEELRRMHKEAKKDLTTKHTLQENEDVKEAMGKREGKEIEYFEDEIEGEQHKSMHMETKKDSTKETMQKNEEAMGKREGREIDHYFEEGESEEPKRMHMEAWKDLTTKRSQEAEAVKEVMSKRKDKDIEKFADKGEGEEPSRLYVEAKDLKKETIQESEDVQNAMLKREGKKNEHFRDKGGEKPKRMHMEAKKNIAKETTQETKGVKEAMVKRKSKEIGNFVDEGEGAEPAKMFMKAKKELTKETKQESERVKEAMVKIKGKETEYVVDKGEGEEPKSMDVETKKDLTSKNMQENEDVREAMVEKEDKDYEYFVDKGDGEELKMIHMETKKSMGKESMQETEGLKEAMAKRKCREIGNFTEGEGKVPKRVHMEAKKDLTTKTMQENECFSDEGEGEEPNRIDMETKKDFTKETLQKSENVKEVKVKREGREIECFVDKSEDKELKRVLIETKRDLTKETMNENDDVKEAIIKRKGKEIEYFVDNSEGEAEEPKRMHTEEKKDLTTESMHEIEDVKEVRVKSKDKEIENFADKGEGKEPKIREAKKHSTKVTMKGSEDAKEAMVKRKGIEAEYFVDKGEEPERMHKKAKDLTTKRIQDSEDEESSRMHTEAKKDIKKETMQESEEFKEAMVKRKGKETGNFVDKGKEPEKMHMEAKKDLTTETTQEKEDVKEAMVRRKDKEIDYFLDEGEGEEPNRMLMGAKRDLTTKTMRESKDVKEATFKRKGKETESIMDQGEGKKPERIHMEVKKDLAKDTMQEREYVKEAIFKRKSKEIDYFGDKGESEELERTHEEAKKDITKEKMQEEVEKIKHGTMDCDQQNVLGKTVKGKFEVSTEEGPKQVGGQDGSRGVKIANMEEPKKTIKEEMDKTESLMEKVQREKSKSEEERRVIQKNTATEILQKETEESNIERKSRDGPNVPNNMVKVVFEVLGTFQAKLPKQVMEAIAQNKKDKNEYVTVKLKGEGSIKMHVEPNEAFDKDETEDRSEKEIRKPKLKSSDQISGKENVDFWVCDESKRPKFLEMGEIQDVKEDNAQIEESAKKIHGDKYEKIQVEEKGRSSTQKGREGPKIQTMVKDQHRLQEEMNRGRFEASKAATEEFPVKMVDSLTDKRERLKETKIEEATFVKEELVKQRSEEKKTNVEEKGEEIERSMKKAKGGLRKKLTEEKDLQCLQEGMSKEIYEASTTEKEFPTKIIDTLANTSEETMDKEVEELARRKTEETNVVESTIEEKVQAPRSGRISMTCKEVPEDKHPKVLGIGSPERELQATKGKEMLTTQEETERPKEKTVDRDQQYVQREVAERAGKVDNIEKEMPQKEYVADPGPIAQRLEKKRDLKATSEREKYIIAQNVEDEKPEIQEVNIEVDVEKVDKKGYQTKAVEGMLKGEHSAEVVPEKEREKPKFAKIEEAKEASISRLPFKREMGKTIKAAEDKKPKMGGITPEFEKASGFKHTAEKTHESSKREHQRESSEVTPKIEMKPPIMTPKKEVEKSKKEEMSPMPTAIQRKEPRELSLPSKDYKIPKIEEVQQKKEGKRAMHALEATTSKEELAQAIATHSKEKSEIDEQQVNELPSPSIEMPSIEPRGLEKHGMKEDDYKAESLDHMKEGKEPLHSIDSTADEADEPSKFSRYFSTQSFEVEGKAKIDVSCHYESQDSDFDSEIDSEASIKGETDEEVLQRETLQPESPEYQQCTNKAQEESHGTHEIEEGKADEEVDEADQEDSQQLEEQKECEEEAIGGKKDQSMSKKLIVSTIIAGSAILASGIFLFIRHRRSRKGAK